MIKVSLEISDPWCADMLCCLGLWTGLQFDLIYIGATRADR